ncbi:MAG: MBL fold metallo-hydrolase [Chloroflexi bacterium]|nr:MAG: MBL fold metallo-hydrolase [Phototrophicales bacterium]RMF76928.1 MAG: MBL fold metallo-hydrolase [Chloroflexota bacterium]
MTIEIKVLTLGPVATNCYIIGDTETNQAILIDPVDDAPLLHKTAQDAGWTIKMILATHGHFDHVLASKELKELTGAPFLIHRADLPFLENLPQQGLMLFGKPFPEAGKPDRYLTTEPETIEVGNIKLETIFTPGHAPGHVAFFMREHEILFGGDCLFAGSIGRTDLPGGNYETLMSTICDKLLPLGDDVRLLPGHNQATTLGTERRSNPFILQYQHQRENA